MARPREAVTPGTGSSPSERRTPRAWRTGRCSPRTWTGVRCVPHSRLPLAPHPAGARHRAPPPPHTAALPVRVLGQGHPWARFLAAQKLGVLSCWPGSRPLSALPAALQGSLATVQTRPADASTSPWAPRRTGPGVVPLRVAVSPTLGGDTLLSTLLMATVSLQTKDVPKRPFSQCLSTIIAPLFAEVRRQRRAEGGWERAGVGVPRPAAWSRPGAELGLWEALAVCV